MINKYGDVMEQKGIIGWRKRGRNMKGQKTLLP